MNDNLKGILLMTLSMAGFVGNDAIVKFVGQTMPLGQMLFLRGLIATALIAVLALLARQSFRVPTSAFKWFFIRLAGEIVTTYCFLSALMQMPLANATAILQATPLAVTLAAILFLNERVGIWRWGAILCGFAGVLIIIRPGHEEFNEYSILVLMAVLGSTVRDMATRHLPGEIGNLSLTVYTSLLITAFGLLMMVSIEEPISVEPEVLLALTGSATFLLLGYFGITGSMRQGEMAVITPFRYTGFLWAILLGFVMFGNLPDGWTILGALIVIASGIVSIVRGLRKQPA